MPLKWLPNTLTILRCLLAFAVGWAILEWGAAGTWHAALPLLAFSLVAASDYLDGLAARRLDAVSALGAFLDPLADKLLVGISLLALCSLQGWTLGLVIPSVAIIGRDLIMTALRLIPNVDLPVSRIAKWKTAAEMLGIGILLAALSFSGWNMSALWTTGLALIWLAAALSVYTLGLYVGTLLQDAKRPR